MVYIIIWAIIQSGGAYYTNPSYHHTIVRDEKRLAAVLDEIQSKAYKVDIKLYKAYPIEAVLSYTEETEETIKKIPHVKLQDEEGE